MNGNKQIERAALLSDTEPAEKLDINHASAFVGSVMKNAKQNSASSSGGHIRRLRPLVLGASAIAAAAVVVLAFLAVNPNSEEFGSPAALSEQSYIHAATAEVDSTMTVQQDSMSLRVEESK